MGSERPSDNPSDRPSAVTLWRVAVALALLLAGLGMVAAGAGPFERGWLGHNGARYALIARNHERLGLTYLGGAPLISAGLPAPVDGGTAPPPQGPEVYAHHPPALGWTIALLFRVAGVSEAAASVLPFVSTLLLLLLFARLVRFAAGALAGAFAVLAAAAQPMLSVYGCHVDVQGTPVLLLSVATLAGYRHWLRGGHVAWMLGAAALASAFDWYGLYMPVACAVHLFWTRRRPEAAAGLVLWSVSLFCLWLAWLASLPGVVLADVLGAASVRGATAMAGSEGRLGVQATAWFIETLDLMPAWPALLCIVVWVAWRTRGLSQRSCGVPADVAEPVSPCWLILLLLAPPVVHGLLFPAGMLMHGYWLFGLPLPLAAATGLLLSAWPAVLAWPAILLLLVQGAASAQRILEVTDPLPRLVGEELAARTAGGEVILTNYDANPFVPGAAGDQYVLMRPEVAYYSDRVVRGGVSTPDELADALARRPDAVWFLLVPWPRAPEAALTEAIQSAATGDPVELTDDPPVFLYRLEP